MLQTLVKKGTDCSVPAAKFLTPRRTVVVDRVVCPFFHQRLKHAERHASVSHLCQVNVGHACVRSVCFKGRHPQVKKGGPEGPVTLIRNLRSMRQCLFVYHYWIDAVFGFTVSPAG